MTTLAVLSLLMTLTPVLVLCKITELDVSKYCINEDTYEVSRSESYNLTWKGDFPKGKWFPCKFTFKPEEDGDDICVTSEVFEMPAYITKLKYYKDGESTADKHVTVPGFGRHEDHNWCLLQRHSSMHDKTDIFKSQGLQYGEII
ncbi:hypothetical protein FSP39_008720 [Pinctada imbricata]|uniref:Uncharacterized protein n=1 Tax=Pinctada imbricata TaxID=66713 RepID=A0AA88XHM3_PINIB|nr:hypothetical protein FSP39_008720 [Pinctada imbricata]